MSNIYRAGQIHAHMKLAAGMDQATATALEDITGLHGEASKNPYTDQVGGRTMRSGLLGAGIGAGLGGLSAIGRGDAGLRMLGGGALGGIIGGASGLGSGMAHGTNEMARGEGLRGEHTIVPELAAGLTGGVAGAGLGGMLGGAMTRGPGGALVGAGLGGVGGAALGLNSVKNMRELGQFRRDNPRKAPVDALTSFSGMF